MPSVPLKARIAGSSATSLSFAARHAWSVGIDLRQVPLVSIGNRAAFLLLRRAGQPVRRQRQEDAMTSGA